MQARQMKVRFLRLIRRVGDSESTAKNGKRRIWGGLEGSLGSAFDDPVVDFAPADDETSSSGSAVTPL